ncbi:MAG: hypothetical protein Q9190_000914 [Brigantiaea leucoxantha]
MSNLSQHDLNIIAEYPLTTSLDHLVTPLQGMQRNHDPISLSIDNVTDDSDNDQQTTLSKLLLALLGHQAAFHLRSKIGKSNLSADLFKLFNFIPKGRYDYEDYRMLIRLVITRASDTDVWNAVFDLVATSVTTTPPTSIPPTFTDTPVKTSSSSQQGSEQTKALVEERIFQEIEKCTYQDVGNFFFKYFENTSWIERANKIYQAVKERHANGRWTDFPKTPVQNKVFKWWFNFQDEFLSSERGIYFTSTTSNLVGGEARRQMDLFVKPNDEKLSKKMHHWKDVEVIGELKESNKEKKATLLQIGRYVRDVFTAQPTRRFIHAFALCGSEMRAWVFDRSGPYSSTAFDIHEEPERFILMIAAYVMMNDEDLGLDTFIERNGADRFITVAEDATGKKTKLQLNLTPIAHQRAIVCRGTTCFRAGTLGSNNPQYVAKFSWVSDKRRPEADLLRLARERGVEGVANLFGHHQITSIADMRDGLTFGKPHAFRDTTPSTPRSLFSSVQSLSPLHIAKQPLKKRKTMDFGESPPKRSRLNSQSPNEATQKNEPKSRTTSLFAYDDTSYDNRIFRCLVISPAGHALHDIGSKVELLETLRDAIKAHRSLYIKGRILHRDVSINNIIMTNPKEANGFKGLLIDMDLAKEVGSGPSGARHRTGTVEFMAIQVLQDIDHTYRHDLESFFYVLLWICAHHANKQPVESILRWWYSGSFETIANNKEYAMSVSGFEKVLREFPTTFENLKPLCNEIRDILFPILQRGVLFTGTPTGPPEELYDPIIAAFENSIEAYSQNQ